ncbi:MAG: sugar ABC transporter permease, partial [Rhizobium leguminosarum]|nr:sugar ABC transporter permease [Rhizobium leguminosarum]
MISSTLRNRRRAVATGEPEPKGWLGLAFILPGLLFIVVLFLVPLVMTIWMSFYNWPLLGRTKFIGLSNYAELISDTQLWHSLAFT